MYEITTAKNKRLKVLNIFGIINSSDEKKEIKKSLNRIIKIMIPIIIGIITANMLKYLLHPIIVGCKNKKFIMLKKNSPNNT